MTCNNKNNGIRNVRLGGTAVEFALVAPIFFMVIFASVEFSRVAMIQNAVENAAFEGARRGIVPGGNAAICKSTTENLVDLAGIHAATVTVAPAIIDSTTTSVAVTVELPMSAENGFGISGFLRDKTMTKTVNLRVERDASTTTVPDPPAG